MHPLILAVAVFIVLGLVGAWVQRVLRHRRIMSAPFPDAWEQHLETHVHPYHSLSREERRQVRRRVQWFVADKRFEGCGGQEITDEIKVAIAGQACLLLLNRRIGCYSRLRSVLVYPSTYQATEGGQTSLRLGESWSTGVVVLAWDSVRRGAENFEDGQNVTFHEFAHQLDQEDGTADGAPILGKRCSYRTWATVLGSSYSKLRRRVKKGRRTVIDQYGATQPAEFFAVATETFFEKPRQLEKHHPELYAELKRYYRLDPLAWE